MSEDESTWRCSCGATEKQPMHTVACEHRPGTIIMDDVVMPTEHVHTFALEVDRYLCTTCGAAESPPPVSCENCPTPCKDIDAYREELLNNPAFFIEETTKVNRMDPFGEWLKGRVTAQIESELPRFDPKEFYAKLDEIDRGKMKQDLERHQESLTHEVAHSATGPKVGDIQGRYFNTGAYRDTDAGKNDYEGFFSPLVIEGFGDYMTRHRVQSDGKLRASDNWQAGIPKDQYMKSAWRHFLDLWQEHRGYPSREGIDEAICGLLFNVMGYYHELLKESLGNHTPQQWWEKAKESE